MCIGGALANRLKVNQTNQFFLFFIFISIDRKENILFFLLKLIQYCFNNSSYTVDNSLGVTSPKRTEHDELQNLLVF